MTKVRCQDRSAFVKANKNERYIRRSVIFFDAKKKVERQVGKAIAAMRQSPDRQVIVVVIVIVVFVVLGCGEARRPGVRRLYPIRARA